MDLKIFTAEDAEEAAALEAAARAAGETRVELAAAGSGVSFYKSRGYEYRNGVVRLEEGGYYRMEKYLTAPENAPDRQESRILMDVIRRRHSYRGPYLPERVPREDLTAIVEAGMAAPSGCNRQTTSFVVVDDEDLLKMLRSVIDPPLGETAPALICVLTRRVNAYRGRSVAVQDYAAAIENMLLMITALGYASCWYEGYLTDERGIGRKMAGILAIPDGCELVCMLPVGRPARGAVRPPKKGIGERVRFNRESW